MPITITFDLKSPQTNELNRIRGFFERLGWEHLGNTAYRYPKLHSEHLTEDWFNHVIPALMLLRAYAQFAAASNRSLEKFSIDVQSSTGFNPKTGVGQLPVDSSGVVFSDPSDSGNAFGLKNLKEWIDNISWPYADEQK